MRRGFTSGSFTVCTAAAATITCAAAGAWAADAPADPLAEARRLRLAGYYARALSAYEALAAADATQLAAVGGMVECFLETGRYAEAADALDRVASAGARDARWHLLRAETAQRVGDYDGAIEHAERAVKLDRQCARARLILAETLCCVGRSAEADKPYAWFERVATTRLPTNAESLTAVGVGFYRHSVRTRHPDLPRRTRHALNQILQAAYARIEADYWPARVAAADLLRRKYNLDEADAEYRAALLVNAHAADAHVGLGCIALEHWGFDEIERRGHRALETNPNHVGALNLLAAGKIVERRYRSAAALCDRALAVNPNHLETLALRASAQLALNDDAGAAETLRRAAAINPASSEVHAILGDALSGLRRFAEAEAHYQQAIAADPTAADPRTALGLMYMQWGDEGKARTALDAAWQLDRFNERTRNTLELLEMLEGFGTIETEHFVVRFDRERDAITGKYFAERLEAMYASVCSAFDATLDRKTVIEIFPTHADFAVRITGKPWIHTIGACTGWVIAVDAPRRDAELMGGYNFAQVLRHEFAHTVTLAVTDNRIPHWFTEGLAVLQEGSARSYEWQVLLAESIRRSELYTLESIDWGFMRPQRRGDRQRAYAQSAWMCAYITETYGADAIAAMLAGFRGRQSQAQVFEKLTAAPPADFDAAFAAWAKAQAATWGFDLTPPEDIHKLRALALLKGEDAETLARLADAEYDQENWDRAVSAGRKSVELDDETNTRGHQALVRALMQAAIHAEDETEMKTLAEEAASVSRRLLAIAPDNRFALRTLAAVLVHRKQWTEAEPVLLRLHAVWSADPFAARQLAECYVLRGDHEQAVPLLREVAAAAEHDAYVPYQLGLIEEQRGALAEARAWFERALEIVPLSADVHEPLARVQMRLGDTRVAVETYKILCTVAPNEARHHTACALACHKLGDKDGALRHARRAVELDPHSAAATLLQR